MDEYITQLTKLIDIDALPHDVQFTYEHQGRREILFPSELKQRLVISASGVHRPRTAKDREVSRAAATLAHLLKAIEEGNKVREEMYKSRLGKMMGDRWVATKLAEHATKRMAAQETKVKKKLDDAG